MSDLNAVSSWSSNNNNMVAILIQMDYRALSMRFLDGWVMCDIHRGPCKLVAAIPLQMDYRAFLLRFLDGCWMLVQFPVCKMVAAIPFLMEYRALSLHFLDRLDVSAVS
jgi:hypothetical protein